MKLINLGRKENVVDLVFVFIESILFLLPLMFKLIPILVKYPKTKIPILFYFDHNYKYDITYNQLFNIVITVIKEIS